MSEIPFCRMSGSGNDFIIIDNRKGVMAQDAMAAFVQRVCPRRLSVGADGVFFLEASDHVDFKWHFFNSDGSRAEMCGNGARCAARFALLNNIAPAQMAFETDAGIIHAHVNGDTVRLRMTEPEDIIPRADLTLDSQSLEYGFANTGVPHVVIEEADINAVDVIHVGRGIRNHPSFAPAGTNVNFLSPLGGNSYAIRTYERGVEGETLACGTGNVAAAIVLAARYDFPSPMKFLTRSGFYLTVHFQYDGQTFNSPELEGDARVIYEGTLHPEALEYP